MLNRGKFWRAWPGRASHESWSQLTWPVALGLLPILVFLVSSLLSPTHFSCCLPLQPPRNGSGDPHNPGETQKGTKVVAPGLEEEAGLELGGSFSGGRFLDPSGEGEGGAEISILDRRVDGGGEYWRRRCRSVELAQPWSRGWCPAGGEAYGKWKFREGLYLRVKNAGVQ